MNGQVLTKENKKFLVGVLDDVAKFPVWAEPFDGLAFKSALDTLDKFGDKYIPDQFDPAINDVAVAVAEGDYETAAVKAGEALDAIINIPLIPDDLEKAIFVDGARFLVRALLLWINKKKTE